MGSVYLAEDNRLEGRKCAVKAVRLDPNASQEVIAELQHQFSREASVLARLDHPNLPKVSDYFDEDGHDYLVMDYVSGKDLKMLMDEARRNGRFLAEAEVLEWARQLCDSLEYMHTQDPSVLHRDIKPSNIKLTPSGFIKLVDFGLVKILSKDDSQTITVMQGRGTAAYTPMEQYGEDDSHTDMRSDIYSVISAHTFGMFAPSIISGWLLDKWGRGKMILFGAATLVLACITAPISPDVLPLGISLFLLGVGWNFCFVGGSTLLADQLSPVERSRTQGTNDLLVGLASAFISLSSGFIFGATNYTVMAIIAATLALVPLFMSLSFLKTSAKAAEFTQDL